MNFHGDALAEKYAELCDAAENDYDAFLMRDGDCMVYPQKLGMLFAICCDKWDYTDSKWKDIHYELSMGNQLP